MNSHANEVNGNECLQNTIYEASVRKYSNSFEWKISHDSVKINAETKESPE